MQIQIIHYGEKTITSETILDTEDKPKVDKYGYPTDPKQYDQDGYPLDEEGIPYDPEAA